MRPLFLAIKKLIRLIKDQDLKSKKQRKRYGKKITESSTQLYCSLLQKNIIGIHLKVQIILILHRKLLTSINCYMKAKMA